MEGKLIPQIRMVSISMFLKLSLFFVLLMGTIAQADVFNDEGMGSIWHYRQEKYFGINLNQTYQEFKNYKANPILVAILDTGVDFNHEDLKNNIWTNPKEIAGNGIDDDNNGYIDDVHGINTIDRDTQGKATNKVMDSHFHGTFMAGIIAGVQNNKIGTAGIASNAKIMILKMVSADKDEADRDVAEALIYAAKNGAKVINCSFAKYEFDQGNLVYETLKKLQDEYGILVIAGAGNFGEDNDVKPMYPASFDLDNIISVGGHDENGKLAHFIGSKYSNYGRKSVDLTAPGVNVYSTVTNSPYGYKYERFYGTSVAAPIVTGVAAELWSRFPELNYKQVKEIILKSVVKDKELKNKVLSGGRLSMYRAFKMAESMKHVK